MVGNREGVGRDCKISQRNFVPKAAKNFFWVAVDSLENIIGCGFGICKGGFTIFGSRSKRVKQIRNFSGTPFLI